jgi:hypothetical protein
MKEALLLAKEALEELYGSDKSIIAMKAITTALAQPLINNVATYTCGLCGVSMSMEADQFTAQQQWAGLTIGERDFLFTKHYQWDDYGKAIEEKLKEKNFKFVSPK